MVKKKPKYMWQFRKQRFEYLNEIAKVGVIGVVARRLAINHAKNPLLLTGEKTSPLLSNAL